MSCSITLERRTGPDPQIKDIAPSFTEKMNWSGKLEMNSACLQSCAL